MKKLCFVLVCLAAAVVAERVTETIYADGSLNCIGNISNFVSYETGQCYESHSQWKGKMECMHDTYCTAKKCSPMTAKGAMQLRSTRLK